MNTHPELTTFFARLGRKMATTQQLLAAGFNLEQLQALVAEGELRQGVTGWWLPAAPDPAAAAIMQAAIRSNRYN